MASESLLQELFQVAKASSVFRGLGDQEVWGACLAYQDRPDEHIRIAMENILQADQAAAQKSQSQQEALEQGREKRQQLRQQEAAEHAQEEQSAEALLESFFQT